MRFIKGKVIIAFLLGCVALFFAFEAGRQASSEILKNVDSLSKPVERLHMVNQLFRDINHLEQLQRTQAIQGNNQDTALLLKESAALRRSLDTLEELYQGDLPQLKRIASMKNILEERDSLFANYLQVREGLVNSRELSEQLTKLTSIYSKSPLMVEKIITTEKTSTITLNQDDRRDEEKKKESKGFLGRLFGKKKTEGASVDDTSSDEKLPHEELQSETVNVTVDTLTNKPANADSLRKVIDKARRTIVSTQRLKSTSFVNREAALMNAGNIMINQMLNVLQEVEQDAVKQVDKNNAVTRDVVAKGANRIIAIILLFVLATAILLYLILTDISRSARYRKQLEKAKDEAERHSAVKQRFLANMSHEIRTPLQSIIGYVEQLREQKNPRKEDIEAIHYSSEHLLQIVNEILDYSRLTSGKFSLKFTAFSLKELLNEIIAVMYSHAVRKSLVLDLKYNTDIDHIKGDPFRLKQILYNLLSNAIKFTRSGTVLLKVDAVENIKTYDFVFVVEDTGSGIPHTCLEDIFKQFEQVSRQASDVTTGTGLGLSIVKELVELQGGTITVSSELNKGSCFTVHLKFAKAQLNETSAISPPDLFKIEGLKVYVVDDDRLILQLCSSILEKHTIEHKCFNSPLELLQNLDEYENIVVLADIRMPEMSGLELCSRLKSSNSTLKIFALTAHALPEERETILEAGFDGLLMKPFREADLLSLLKGNEPEIPVTESDLSYKLDLSSIEMMTFDDKERFIKVLMQYVTDTEEDLKQLLQMEGPEPEVSFLLHRLSGRSAQLGANKLATLMRELEILILNEGNSCPVSKEDIKWIAGEVQSILKLVKEEISRLSGTSPSYNKEFSGQY